MPTKKKAATKVKAAVAKAKKAVTPKKKAKTPKTAKVKTTKAPKLAGEIANATLIPPDYKPTEKEEYMNPVMLEYFRHKLLRWREDLLRESFETIQELQEAELQKPDIADRASAETDHALELKARDRERKLIGKINEALERINVGDYGYCEETGEPIGVARLDARPIAVLSLEAQERHERMERTQRDERE